MLAFEGVKAVLERRVISLTAAAAAPFGQRLAVLVAMSVVMTVGIHGLIAALVRLDDLGLALVRGADPARQAVGHRLGRRHRSGAIVGLVLAGAGAWIRRLATRKA